MPGEDTTDPSETPQQEAKYTDADMQKAVQTRLGKEAKKYESAIAELQAKAAQAEELAAKLAQVEEEREMAGKSAAEKAQAQAQKQLDKLQREIEERNKLLAERDAAISATTQRLQSERAAREMADAMSSAKVLSPQKAARFAMVDIQIEHTEDGMTASYDGNDGLTIKEAVEAWTKNNPEFLPALPGGAGTQRGAGHVGGRKPQDMSIDELLTAASRRK